MSITHTGDINLPQLSPTASEADKHLLQALYDQFRDDHQRLWALETVLGITPRRAADAWTAYTPTVSAFAGSFTSITATGRYKRIGNTVFYNIQVLITTLGTATLGARVSLPVTAQSAHFVGAGREDTAVGVLLAVGALSTTDLGVQKYDATFPAANGWNLVLTGTYEAA